MATTYLTRTPSSSGTTTKCTISVWLKRSNLGAENRIIIQGDADGNPASFLKFKTDSTLEIVSYSGSYDYRLVTNRVFKDTSAWYHIVMSVDTTQATSSDRVKIYVNGVQETSFSTETYPSQNYATKWNSTSQIWIGQNGSSAEYFDGLMSHFHLIDGTAYQASDFGETDSTTGEWKIKTSPSVSYGTNGFFILKDGNSVTDQSGNSNNLTATGTLTNTEDCPSNNFATLNSLDNAYVGQKPTFSNGNTTGAGTETGFLAGASSIGVSSGKYYAEFKVTGGNTSFHVFGVLKSPVGDLKNTAPHDSTRFYGVRGVGTKIQPGGGGGETASWTGTWTTNDIISLALDMDNNRLYVAKNGQYADGAGAYNQAFTGSPAYITLASDETYHLMGASISTGSGVSLTMQSNFGNGYFGTTAISSEGTNASGIGKFEYDVPTGYTALSTKGLNE
jgi:hypothetical protein